MYVFVFVCVFVCVYDVFVRVCVCVSVCVSMSLSITQYTTLINDVLSQHKKFLSHTNFFLFFFHFFVGWTEGFC